MSSFGCSPSLAAQWRSVRRLYPIYTVLAEKFELGAPPFPDLDQVGTESETDVIARIQDWLAEMDEGIQPHQFRQMLQGSGIANAEEKLDALVRRHLEKRGRGEADRDKLDFLLTQYVAVCAPPSFQARELSLEEVAQVLEPVLGECATHVPQWLEPLERLIQQMQECSNLEQLESLEIVQRGRELKASAGEKFFTGTTLMVFTRFSYLLRYTFARLFAAEAQTIDQSLQELEGRGITVVDGTEAGLSAEEPIETVRELLHAATTSAAPAYSACNTSKRLRSLRAAVERSLTRTKSAEADQARSERLEFELEELRRELTRLRQECEELRASLAERDMDRERVPVGGSEPPSSVPEPPSPQLPQLPQPAPIAAAEPIPAAGKSLRTPAPEVIDVNAEVEQCLARMRKSLRGAGSRPTAVLRIRTGTLLLSEGELQLLQSNADPNDDVTKIMETAVGTRALLVEKCELRKAGQAVDLTPLLQLAKDVLGELQRLGGMHGPQHDAIAATTRQLWNLVQHAQKAARQART
jgi:hypothetical protein